VADARSDSATHWHAVANAVNSATLLDTDSRYPYPPKTARPVGSMAQTNAERSPLMSRYWLIRCYARLRQTTLSRQYRNFPAIHPRYIPSGSVATLSICMRVLHASQTTCNIPEQHHMTASQVFATFTKNALAAQGIRLTNAIKRNTIYHHSRDTKVLATSIIIALVAQGVQARTTLLTQRNRIA
jgi:hypothetical protein